ncbi:heavy metal translocating P-type ATPase [Enterococcus saccharolyticus]|uniref:Cd(2+)-exporting ATPase n=1 Tax=Candidatus Enterococcus willemsii TaxID=1857215 RepID=A0ABQ6Z1I1_9ENTE|nr:MULTISPECIES: heavy metal translocating P-type ATPase [Enterococcus]KAF1305030.1 copper-translocating P-type ATPase [Enterococcus sp. CU12B]MCD5003669.1 heavy metal translocating P-type ATPase [Enterococcus saccharolyticus]
MQQTLLKHKNHLMWINGSFILISFFNHFLLHNQLLFATFLIIASVLGVLPIAIQAYQALKLRIISIDLLVTIAVIGAFIIKNYEEAAIVTFLFLFGSFLEQRTLNKTRTAIKELVQMAPETAWKQNNNHVFEEVGIDSVEKNDVLLVKTGGKIPVDGEIIFGQGTVNEASITGESTPVHKTLHSDVFAGTLLDNGTIQIQAKQVGEDTVFGKIIELVEEAQESKSAAERFIDQFSKYYTPAVLLLAGIVWFVSQNIELTITVLVLGCPGALVIGVPVSNVAGIGKGAKNGILLKGSETIHHFSKISTMVFDKTGTLTLGMPKVIEQEYFHSSGRQELSYLASIEQESDHPLATAILEMIGETTIYPVSETHVTTGGIIAKVDGHHLVVGNLHLMEKEQILLTPTQQSTVKMMELRGNSLVLVAVDHVLKIILGIRDQIRPEVKTNLDKLQQAGVKNLVMLSGDNQGTVDFIAKELGLTQAYGNMLPEDKSNFIKQLQKEGQTVAFVGDGINDSPSLAVANIGIAMGSGTDVAIETSDIVLIYSDFAHLSYALTLAKATVRNMKQNITIAVGVVLFLLFSLFLSTWMNMSIGMFVHEASILVVILNGLRLLHSNKKIAKT